MQEPIEIIRKINIDDVFEDYYDPIKREERKIKEQREKRSTNKRNEAGL